MEEEEKGVYFKNWLFLGLASLKSIGQVGRLEIPERADAAILSPKANLRLSSFFREPPFFLLKLSTYWVRLTHIVEGNLLYSESLDLNVNHIKKNISTAASRLAFSQTTGC